MSLRSGNAGLLLFSRGNEGAAYDFDWQQIASRVSRFDPYIKTKLLKGLHLSRADYAEFGKIPTLAVVLYDHVPVLSRGRVIRNRMVSKLEQLKAYRNHNIPFPPTAVFHWGMKLDQSIFGDFVILKPLDLKAGSRGIAQLWKTNDISSLNPGDFPKGHPMRSYQHLVQKYIHTGDHPTSCRVLNFCHANVVSYIMRLENSVDLNSNLKQQTIATNGGTRQRFIKYTDSVLELAQAASHCYPTIPLQAFDIVTEELTGKHYVLEGNLGGNTWHFSSRYAEQMRQEMGPGSREEMLAQLDCYNTAAKALARSTRSLAQ